MLATLTKKRMSVIGIDFGTCSLRGVQLYKKGGQWHIHHWFNVEIEPTASEPPAVDYEIEMQPAFGPGTFSDHRASLVLSPPDVEYRLLDLPAALVSKPAAELKNALQFELDRQMPWPVAESQIAAWPIKPDGSGNVKTMVVSARTSTLQRRLEAMATQRLECCRADIVPNTMTQVCRAASEPRSADSEPPMWGVLDIGFQSCRLYLIHGDRPVYARDLGGGGRELTETLAAALHVDFRIAEQYKRIYGIRQTDRGFRSAAGGLNRVSEDELPGVLYAIARHTIETLAKDIERAYRFALGQLAGATAGPIYLIGGGARLTGLVKVLSAHLGVPVLLPDPKVALPAVQSGGNDGSNNGDHPAYTPHPACTPANFPVLAPCVGLAMMEGQP